MTEDHPAPPGVDASTPSTARVYDYLLGGKDNFAADREMAERLLEMVPEVGPTIRANRAFLGRAVRYLAEEAGVRQFIDLGTGVPTQDNVHQVAGRVQPDSRVVYVDKDPIVLAHGRALLSTDANTIVIEADFRDPQAVLNHPELPSLIDLAEPVAVLFVSVLHFVTDEENPRGTVAGFRDRVAPGSYLVISHASEGDRPDDARAAAAQYRTRTSETTVRTPEQIRDLFDGFELVEPGLVNVPDWRPDLGDRKAKKASEAIAAAGWMYAGVGRKNG